MKPCFDDAMAFIQEKTAEVIKMGTASLHIFLHTYIMANILVVGDFQYLDIQIRDTQLYNNNYN